MSYKMRWAISLAIGMVLAWMSLAWITFELTWWIPGNTNPHGPDGAAISRVVFVIFTAIWGGVVYALNSWRENAYEAVCRERDHEKKAHTEKGYYIDSLQYELAERNKEIARLKGEDEDDEVTDYTDS